MRELRCKWIWLSHGLQLFSLLDVKEVPKDSEENQRLIYTRGELIELSKCEFVKNFPDSLSLALKNDPDIFRIVLIEVGCLLLFSGKQLFYK